MSSMIPGNSRAVYQQDRAWFWLSGIVCGSRLFLHLISLCVHDTSSDRCPNAVADRVSQFCSDIRLYANALFEQGVKDLHVIGYAYWLEQGSYAAFEERFATLTSCIYYRC